MVLNDWLFFFSHHLAVLLETDEAMPMSLVFDAAPVILTDRSCRKQSGRTCLTSGYLTMHSHFALRFWQLSCCLTLFIILVHV